MASPRCQAYQPRDLASGGRPQDRRRTSAVARPASTVKIAVYLTNEVAKRFRVALRRSGMTKSGLVNEALARFLDPPPASEPGQEVLQALRALFKRVRRLQRETEVASETLALFVRYFLMVTPPVPESEQHAAKALGRERYEVFIQQIAKRITSDEGMVVDVIRAIVRTHPHLVAEAVTETRRGDAIGDLFPANSGAAQLVERAEGLSHA
jgi:hypothetical protein